MPIEELTAGDKDEELGHNVGKEPHEDVPPIDGLPEHREGTGLDSFTST